MAMTGVFHVIRRILQCICQKKPPISRRLVAVDNCPPGTFVHTCHFPAFVEVIGAEARNYNLVLVVTQMIPSLKTGKAPVSAADGATFAPVCTNPGKLYTFRHGNLLLSRMCSPYYIFLLAKNQDVGITTGCRAWIRTRNILLQRETSYH